MATATPRREGGPASGAAATGAEAASGVEAAVQEEGQEAAMEMGSRQRRGNQDHATAINSIRNKKQARKGMLAGPRASGFSAGIPFSD